MNCLMGCILIAVAIVLAASYPFVFLLILVPGFVVWFIKWANKQAEPNQPAPPTNTGKQVSQASQRVGPQQARPTPTPAQSLPSTPPRVQPAPHPAYAQASDLKWMGPGSRFTVGGYEIKDPLVYCSVGEPRPREASCIDYRLQVGRPTAEPKGALGYWPDYRNMSAAQRANYLQWLSGGRRSSLSDIGYVFVFFYGLERRVLIDAADVQPIVSEVVRLLNTYGFSGSFNSYASHFLAYVAAKAGIERLAEGWFHTLAEPFIKIGGEPLSFALAWLYVHEKPLPAHLAYLFALQDARFSRSVVIERLPDQFRQLFEKKYRDKLGDGLMLRCAKRPHKISYQTATPSFRTSEHLTPIEIPDVMGIPSQFSALVELWDSCIEELKPLSRKVSKGVEVNTREAYNALPPALKAEIDHPDKPLWEKAVTSHLLRDNLAVLQAGDLATINGLQAQAKLSSRQSLEIAETAGFVGFTVVPDPRLTGQAYRWDDKVAVFRVNGDPRLPSDPSYKSAMRMLELGVAMAAADGRIEQEEIDHVAQFLEAQFGLSPDDVLRLEAYREVLVQQPPSLKSLASRLKTALSVDQRKSLCRFLVGVAAADGNVPKEEIKSLKSVYLAFELDEADLFVLLHELSSTSEGAVEIAVAGTAKPGEPIPTQTKPEEPAIAIDHERVRQLLAETAVVSKMLGEAMQEIIPEDGPILEIVGPQTTVTLGDTSSSAAKLDNRLAKVDPEVLLHLDTPYQGVVAELLSRDEWTKNEFDKLVRDCKLMPSAVITAINDWSDEYLGDFLIEEGSSLHINKQILEGGI